MFKKTWFKRNLSATIKIDSSLHFKIKFILNLSFHFEFGFSDLLVNLLLTLQDQILSYQELKGDSQYGQPLIYCL